MNLTAVREPDEIAVRHYCESLFFAGAIPWDVRSVADIGSGAGFPGVAVAVVHPEARVTLVESNHRKAVFLKESTRAFRNVRVLAARAEDIHDRFDLITSRAVTPDDVLALAPKVSSRVGMLVSEQDAVRFRNEQRFTWNIVPVPFLTSHTCVFASST